MDQRDPARLLQPFSPLLQQTETHGSASTMSLSEEEKAQLHTKIKIEGTIDRQVFINLKEVYETEKREAEAEDKSEPSFSQVLEMILRKGIKVYKSRK